MATLLKRFQNIKLYPGDKPGVENKEALSLLAVAQKHSGLRVFFLRVSKLLLRGSKLSNFKDSKELQTIVTKFSPTEYKIYNKTLVKLGFPRLVEHKGRVYGFLEQTISGVKTVKKRPGAVKVASKTVEAMIKQHIDFLKEESFFQKAHKAAKQHNIIDRSESAREFFHDYAAEYGLNYRSLQMLRTGGRRITDVKLGRMYFFRYEAESSASGRDVEMHGVYDKFPLIFLLSETPGSLEGINFHYIYPEFRIHLLGKMFMYLNSQDFSNRTKLIARKFRKVIQENKIFRHAKVCYREYKPGRIASKILQVHPMDWELAITVPTERFVTPNGGRVPSKKIWTRSRKLARKF